MSLFSLFLGYGWVCLELTGIDSSGFYCNYADVVSTIGTTRSVRVVVCDEWGR